MQLFVQALQKGLTYSYYSEAQKGIDIELFIQGPQGWLTYSCYSEDQKGIDIQLLFRVSKRD